METSSFWPFTLPRFSSWHFGPRDLVTMAAIVSRVPVFAPRGVVLPRARVTARACGAPQPAPPAQSRSPVGHPLKPATAPSSVGPTRASRGCVKTAAVPGASLLFEVAVPPPPLVIVPPTIAFMTCILAVMVIALLGRDDHGMLLAQIALNAPFAVTTWWLGEQGHAVCFVVLAARTFFGAHLSGRFDALLNCFATLGLLVITAPNQAWIWRDTVWAQWVNVAICVYRLVTHTKAGDGGDTGSRESKAFVFFAAFMGKIGLLCLALPGIGLFNGFF